MVATDLLLAARRALQSVADPETGRDIVSAGLLSELSVSPQGVAKATLSTTAPGVAAAARDALQSVAGIARAVVVGPVVGSGEAARAAPVGHANPLGIAAPPRIETAAAALAGVRRVVAVASGKGGVGKSTLAANLAVALARRGLKVGLLDADIYGPSLPTLFGLAGRPQMRSGRIVPVEAFGVRAMSIGLLVDEDKALAWRGPMVMGAVRQLIGDVEWGELDILLIDTPPGTGDAHLSLIQSRRLDGAVIVSTPQELALADVRRGIALFRSTGIEILGVVENMAYLDAGGERHYIFGRGGAERAAADAGAPFLGVLPIFEAVREASDAGAPIVAAAPESPAARAFDALAARLIEKLALNS
jgi:ATP-binding protein involved in chromosome partitioning